MHSTQTYSNWLYIGRRGGLLWTKATNGNCCSYLSTKAANSSYSQYLGRPLTDGDVNPSKSRVMVFGDAALALEQTTPEDRSRLFDGYTRLAFLVGGSVTEALSNLAVYSRVLPGGKNWIATTLCFGALQPDGAEGSGDSGTVKPETAFLKKRHLCLYPGLKHVRVMVSIKENYQF